MVSAPPRRRCGCRGHRGGERINPAHFGNPVRLEGMRVLVLALVLAIAGCSEAPIVAGPEIPTINPMIGDASFLARYGRPPTLADDATDRIRTHLAYVEAQLRVADVSALSPEARAARTRTLDNLRRYWERGEFPASDAEAQLLPTFVDDAGVRCAVAFLAEQDLGAAPILDINHRYRNAYIAQIDAPALVAWADTSGLSRAELAMVQPAYPPRPSRRVDYRLTADYRYAADQDTSMIIARGATTEADLLSSLISVRGDVRALGRMNPIIGEPIVGISGGIGWAGGDRLTYDAHVRVGSQLAFRDGRIAHLFGGTLGFGVDAVGDRIERAVTVPADGYYFAGPQRSSLRFGVLGGPRFAVTTDRGTGWRGALGLIVRDVWKSHAADFYTLRDLRFELGVERMADVTFLGLTVSLASRSAFGWWDRS